MMSTNYDRLAEIARSRQGVRCAAADQCLSVRAKRHLRSHLRRVLARLRDAFRADRRHRHRRAARPGNGGTAGPARRLRRRTVRVTPRGTVQPCVYWPGPAKALDLLLDAGEPSSTRGLRGCPRPARPCRGCTFEDPATAAARAAGAGWCSWSRSRPLLPRGARRARAARHPMAPSRDLPKLESACTTIVMARD